MPKCIVIADDLTGANATGVLLKKMNYSAYTVLNAERLELSMLEQCDCVLYPTDSRGIDQDLAYRRVSNVCNLLKNEDTKVYGKRIDSTLRGNLGAEVDAMLESLGEDYVAIVVACFPTSSRIVLGGYMLVEGLPLHKTDIAIDPKTPVNNPEVAELFRKQSKYPIASILMKDLLHGKHYLADCMKKLAEEGKRIIVVDCVSQEDISSHRKEGEKQGFGCGRQRKSSYQIATGRAVAFSKMQERFCGNQGAFGRGRAVGAGGPKGGGCYPEGCG